MTGLTFVGRKVALSVTALLATAAIVSGCAGPTTVNVGAQPQQYQVSMQLDPPTLNPPQVGTLSFTITDSRGKLVTTFDPVYGAIFQNVTFSRDLRQFTHSYAESISQGVTQYQVAVSTSFPEAGTYYTYSYFQPAGAPLQIFTGTITTGQASSAEPGALVEDSSPKLSGGVQYELLRAPDPIRAGQPAQLAFHATERGIPVTSLWPLLGAPGHLWIIPEGGTQLAHEAGTARSTVVISNTSGLSAGTPMPVPTFAPRVTNGLATITSATQPTLLPAQATAQRSVLETPAVQPAVAYGPDVVFSHTFPSPGLYKLWLETQYRNQVTTVDFVVRVVK